MTWPFENDTSAITKKLAKKSLQSEKRRNLMVVIAVALAAFLILSLIHISVRYRTGQAGPHGYFHDPRGKRPQHSGAYGTGPWTDFIEI